MIMKALRSASNCGKRVAHARLQYLYQRLADISAALHTATSEEEGGEEGA